MLPRCSLIHAFGSHEWVYLSVDGKGYDIFVMEVGKESFRLKCVNEARLGNSMLNSRNHSSHHGKNIPAESHETSQTMGALKVACENNAPLGIGVNKKRDDCS